MNKLGQQFIDILTYIVCKIKNKLHYIKKKFQTFHIFFLLFFESSETFLPQILFLILLPSQILLYPAKECLNHLLIPSLSFYSSSILSSSLSPFQPFCKKVLASFIHLFVLYSFFLFFSNFIYCHHYSSLSIKSIYIINFFLSFFPYDSSLFSFKIHHLHSSYIFLFLFII